MRDFMQCRGLMLVLSSPSGAGKTTLCHQLTKLNPHFYMSVSVTTRPKRPLEKEGKDYFFVSEDTFQAMRQNNAFLECAQVFDHHYGTLRQPVEEALQKSQDVLFDLDWQGAQTLRRAAPDDVVSIFILPPSWQILEQRLRSRAQDPEEIVLKRMSKALDEISHWVEYPYVLINDDLDRVTQEIQAILKAERLKRVRQSGLMDFVQSLKEPKRS